jgi:hypothetical protein
MPTARVRRGKNKSMTGRNALVRKYLRFFSPLKAPKSGYNDNSSLEQPSPFQDVPTYATGGTSAPPTKR